MSPASNSRFLFVANHAALDFLNTQVVERGEVVDWLQSPADYLAWLQASGLVKREDLPRLQYIRVGKNTDLLKAARRLRQEVRRAAENIVIGKPVPASCIKRINRVLANGRAVAQLERQGGELRLIRRPDFRRVADLLVPPAEAAADLLAHAEYDYIRKCENPRCILYFYDASKNHARRWCRMDACGSQHKARTYYQRRKRVASKKY